MLRGLLREIFGRMRRARGAARAGSGAGDRLAGGLACHQRGDLAGAEREYRAALEADPGDTQALHLLGHVLGLQGRRAESVEMLARVAALSADDAEVRFNLAQGLRAQRRRAEAERALREALRIRPRFAAASVSLGDLLVEGGRLDEAEDCYQAALGVAPGFAEAHYNYGNVLHREGRIDEAIARYREAVRLDPSFVRAHSNLVYALNFSADHTPAEVFSEHLEWARRHAGPLVPGDPRRRVAREAGRRLRVGYVSPNLRDHAVTYFFEPTLKHHDRERFGIYLYSDVSEPDACTERLRGYGDTWRDITGLSDAAVAERVREDEIDILVDLTGHTDGHRLLMFARKPAPVQVTWNGYANTTGLDTMDYRIVDAYTDPPGMTEQWHTERLVRMPQIYMAFAPPLESPPVAPPPVEANGYITFGSFNALSKVGPRVLDAWSRILHAVPGARLLMLTVPEGRTRKRLLEQFAARGIDGSRVELAPRLAIQAFLAAHARADIALDPFPFSGTTTTCQTLWMGVPLITLAGGSHVSRVGVSMLSNLGLERWVARSVDDYVALAAQLAAERSGLRALREDLRERMKRSPNTDGATLTRHLEDAYREMWEDCERQSTGAAGDPHENRR